MNTRLAETDKLTISRFAQAFDGYAYTRQVWAKDDDNPLQELLATRYR